MEDQDGRVRKAPYAPITALRDFLSKIRHVAVPNRVDRNLLQRLNVASNNEWALISALKYLGIIDERGIPTSAYRRLMDDQTFADTFRHLVETSYRTLLEDGGLRMSEADLQNYFRVTSSPSQAKTAARFFREVTRLAGLDAARFEFVTDGEAAFEAPDQDESPERASRAPATNHEILLAKARLLDKLPAPRPEWSAAEYKAICDDFVRMLASLDVEL